MPHPLLTLTWEGKIESIPSERSPAPGKLSELLLRRGNFSSVASFTPMVATKIGTDGPTYAPEHEWAFILFTAPQSPNIEPC